jgi:hypothetical protein
MPGCFKEAKKVQSMGSRKIAANSINKRYNVSLNGMLSFIIKFQISNPKSQIISNIEIPNSKPLITDYC